MDNNFKQFSDLHFLKSGLIFETSRQFGNILGIRDSLFELPHKFDNQIFHGFFHTSLFTQHHSTKSSKQKKQMILNYIHILFVKV